MSKTRKGKKRGEKKEKKKERESNHRKLKEGGKYVISKTQERKKEREEKRREEKRKLVECRSTVPKVVGSSPIAVIFPYSIVGKIPACHAGVPGSIPGEGASFLLFFFLLNVL